MTSLYVDRRGVELRLDGGAIVFYENAQRIGTVPIAPLERIFLRGNVLVHSNLLGCLGEHGVGLIVLSGRRGDPSLMLARPHNDAARRVAQYRLSQEPDFCLQVARRLVTAKLAEAGKLLEELQETSRSAYHALGKAQQQLAVLARQAAGETSLPALRGLEGRAAACYFAGLAAHLPASLGFIGRNRRPPRDPVNALLSLGYTILHAEMTVALYGAGLDPYIGFYHGLNFGRESLASDMIEPLRPLIDRFSIGLFSEGHLRKENFSISEQGCLLGKAGRVRFYPFYEEAAEDFRKRITQNISDMVAHIKNKGEYTDVDAGCTQADSDFDEDFDIVKNNEYVEDE
jgi:CRISPR-associated protein Cas1